MILAKRLSGKIGAPLHDLDDLFWDNSAESYGTRAKPEVRDEKLQAILQLPNWIIEGVYHQWLDESFRLADVIVILNPSVGLRDWRILKRFNMRKLGLAKGKRETLKGLFALLRWNHSFDEDNLRRAQSVLAPHRDKVQYFRSATDALKAIGEKSQQPDAEVQSEGAPSD